MTTPRPLWAHRKTLVISKADTIINECAVGELQKIEVLRGAHLYVNLDTHES